MVSLHVSTMNMPPLTAAPIMRLALSHRHVFAGAFVAFSGSVIKMWNRKLQRTLKVLPHLI